MSRGQVPSGAGGRRAFTTGSQPEQELKMEIHDTAREMLHRSRCPVWFVPLQE